MPVPTPKQDEAKEAFVARCMSDEKMREEFGEPKQRAAVCFSQWEKKDK